MFTQLKKALLGASLLFAGAAYAVPVTYLGADDAVTNLSEMVNANAAAADFFAVTGAISTFGFETAIPANLLVSGGNTVSSSCGSLCGFNTTVGGSMWRNLNGGSVTFTFVDPVDAFGFYVNGLQTDIVQQQTIEYTDGEMAQQIINMPSAINGGGAFVGFVDFGQLISSVTFNATNDILGFDDLYFGRSATNPEVPVPAPSVLLLLIAGVFASRFVRK